MYMRVRSNNIQNWKFHYIITYIPIINHYESTPLVLHKHIASKHTYYSMIIALSLCFPKGSVSYTSAREKKALSKFCLNLASSQQQNST